MPASPTYQFLAAFGLLARDRGPEYNARGFAPSPIRGQVLPGFAREKRELILLVWQSSCGRAAGVAAGMR